DSWRAKKVDSLRVLGDAACAAEVIATALAQRLNNLRIAVGLDAADLAAEPTRMPLLLASSGSFPLRRSDSSSALFGFKKRHGRPASFLPALVPDAALLA